MAHLVSMFDCFTEIRNSWKSLADELGMEYSDEPETFEGQEMTFWRPAVLVKRHRAWTIQFKSNPFSPRIGFLPPKYVIFVKAEFIPKRTFDVGLRSLDALEHCIDVVLSSLGRVIPKSRRDSELEQTLFPVNLQAARTGVSEIDLHYKVVSHESDDPRKIFFDPGVREAVLAVPKVGLRIRGFPDIPRKHDRSDAIGSMDFMRSDVIGSMDFMRADDKERLKNLARLYAVLLDRLATLGYIQEGTE